MNFTIRIPASLKAEFMELARAEDRPASILVRDFMREYIRRRRAADLRAGRKP